jgi:uncharacterized membrane protein YdfJ with MMPL/SSD domain
MKCLFFYLHILVKAVYDFVRNHLADHKRVFELYVAPPKRSLKTMSRSLAQEQLIPAAILNIRFEDDQKAPYLSDQSLKAVEMISMPTSFMRSTGDQKEEEAIMARANQQNTKEMMVIDPDESQEPSSSITSSLSQDSTTTQMSSLQDSGKQPSEKSIPRWLKLHRP